jgi:predicted Zn-dependent peptidase
MTQQTSPSVLDRNIAPQLRPIDHISFVAPAIYTLKSGAKLYWRNGLQNETSKIELHFAAGSATGDPLTASLCAGLLINGTAQKTAKQIQNALDAVGAYYDVSLSQETTVVTVYALKDQLLNAYQIFHESLFAATFPPKELQELVHERSQKFKVQQQKVSFMAQRHFQRSLFAGCVYAQQIQLEDFQNADRSAIQAFHQQHYLHGLKKVFLIGDISEDTLQAFQVLLNAFESQIAARKAFEWQPEQGATHIEHEGAVQSALRIGRPLFNKTHPDFCAFSVLNTILGDYFGSRLMSNIREDKGYTYGIGSHLVENNNFGYMVIGTEVGVQTRIATFTEIQKEFERLQTELVPAEELELVKSYLMGQLLKSADGPYAMLDLFANVETMGLDLSHYDRYIAEIKAVDALKLQELAKRYLNWEEMLIISAG